MGHGKELGHKLKELGVRKKELAELMGVHPNTITQWLSKDIIGIATRMNIATALNLSESEVFSVGGDSPVSESLLLQEPPAVYGWQASANPAKKLNALQYCGLFEAEEDGLTLQRKWRSEW